MPRIHFKTPADAWKEFPPWSDCFRSLRAFSSSRSRQPPAADTIELSIYSDIPGATVYINHVAQQRVTPLLVKFEAAKGFFKNKTVVHRDGADRRSLGQ